MLMAMGYDMAINTTRRGGASPVLRMLTGPLKERYESWSESAPGVTSSLA